MDALTERIAVALRSPALCAAVDPAIAAALGDLDVEAAVARVGSDPSLAAAVMREACATARSGAVPQTLPAAVWRLGVPEVARVASAHRLDPTTPLAALYRAHRHHAVMAATLARELAPRRGVAPDEAYLAGLLHDFGALLVITALAGEPLPPMRAHVRAALVDEHHVDAGCMFAARWQMPAYLAEVIAHHHAPERCQRIHRALVHLITMVDTILAIVERPDLGLPALTSVAGLDHDERFRVRAIAADPRVRAGTIVETEHTIDDQARWPIHRSVRLKQVACVTSHVSASTLVLRGAQPVEVGWLTELVVEDASPFTMLVNIQACTAAGDGVEIVAEPFGLDGPTRAAWLRLVKTARSLGGNA